MLLSTASLRCSASFASPDKPVALQGAGELMPLLRQQLDAVGGQELVVAERGGNRPRIRSGIFQPRLHVVLAVAAGLERVDADRLLAREPGRGRDLGVGALRSEERRVGRARRARRAAR